MKIKGFTHTAEAMVNQLQIFVRMMNTLSAATSIRLKKKMTKGQHTVIHFPKEDACMCRCVTGLIYVQREWEMSHICKERNVTFRVSTFTAGSNDPNSDINMHQGLLAYT